MQIRLNVLKRVEVLLFKYLDTCERLTLLEEDDRQAWQAMLKLGESSDSGGGQGQPISREQKIERFRCDETLISMELGATFAFRCLMFSRQARWCSVVARVYFLLLLLLSC